MNPQYGAALERARQAGEEKFGGILGALADILDELNNSSDGSSKGSSGESFGRHFKPPSFGGGSAQGFPPEADAAPPRMVPEPYPAPGIPPDPENPKLPRSGREVVPIPLARNGAQGEFVEEGQSGQRAGQQQHQSQADDSADGHWVTIDHYHVFIHEPQGGPGRHAQQAAKKNLRKRKEIADIALEYNHSTAWAFDKKKDNFPAGSNKCNKFVYDVTKEAGAEATVIGSDGRRRPPLASEWADPHTVIPNWRVLGPGELPQPGDVAAWPFHYSDATGHSGIVTSVDRSGHVTAIAAHENVVGPDRSFNPSHNHPKVTCRRYTGE